MLRLWTIALASLALALAGCGDDEEATIAGGASGATGAGSGSDVDAKADARDAQVALEVYATDNNGSYVGADDSVLARIEPSLAAAEVIVLADESTYEIKVNAPSGATYSVVRDPAGEIEYPCEPPGTGGCPEAGDWN